MNQIAGVRPRQSESPMIHAIYFMRGDRTPFSMTSPGRDAYSRMCFMGRKATTQQRGGYIPRYVPFLDLPGSLPGGILPHLIMRLSGETMAKTRSTIEVKKVRDEINRLLTLEHLPDESRKTLCFLVEKILMDTGNYRGFNYYDWLNGGGMEKWIAAGRPAGMQAQYLGNEYKRIYY